MSAKRNNKRFFRITAVLLSATLLLLCGCGTGDGKKKSQNTDETTVVSQSESNQPESRQTIPAAEPSSAKAESSEASTAEQRQVPTIQNTVCLDQNGVRITAESLEWDEYFGMKLRLLIENSTGSKLTVSANHMTVNDYMIAPVFTVDAETGKQTREELIVFNSDLDRIGIRTVGRLELSFAVMNSEFDVLFESEPVTVKTSLYDRMDVPQYADKGKTLYEKDGLKINAVALKDDSFWGKALLLYVENQSNQSVIVQTEDVSVNGTAMNPLFSCTVYPERKALEPLSIFSSELEHSGIEDVEVIKLKFLVLDPSSYETKDKTAFITLKAAELS